MNISQALRRVKKLKGILAEQQTRATRSTTFRADQKPAHSFEESNNASLTVRNELMTLQADLAFTNATTRVDVDGQLATLSKAVLVLADLKGQIAWYRGLDVRAQETTLTEETDYDQDMKYHKKQVSWTCVLPEAKRDDLVQKLQEKFDRLNDAVETLNHQTVLKSYANQL